MITSTDYSHFSPKSSRPYYPAARLATLAKLADPEPNNWNGRYSPDPSKPYPVLYNYIYNTYQRVRDERKIVVTDDGFACFDTGLAGNSEDILAVVPSTCLDTSKFYWAATKFYKSSAYELSRFSSLPEKANYFVDPKNREFDTTLRIGVDYQHIAEKRERFPSTYSEKTCTELEYQVEKAWRTTETLLKRNNTVANPQFYQGRIQWLLPLYLTKPPQPDLALVADRVHDIYLVRTCLKLGEAYNNARLTGRPRDWLAI